MEPETIVPASSEPTAPAKLEALLFFYGEPLTVQKTAGLLGFTCEECETALAGLEKQLSEDASRGLALLRRGDEIRLATKPIFQDIGEKILKEEIRENLTPAALETLALVAYLGPIPRSTVDFIRGVNSSFILRNLAMRGLVDRDEQGNHYVYKTSFKFLEHMGLAKPEDLPEYAHFHEILARFEAQATETQTVEGVVQEGSDGVPSANT